MKKIHAKFIAPLMVSTFCHAADLVNNPGVVYQQTPNAGTATVQQIDQLHQAIDDILKETKKNAAAYPQAQEAVIIIGPSGSGKSTPINFLAKKDLQKQKTSHGWLLTVNDPLPGSVISPKLLVAGTWLPFSWFKSDDRVIVWDCPGFTDPRGDGIDIVNAFSINSLFKGRFKLVITITEEVLVDGATRGTVLVNLFGRLGKIFPSEPRLKECLSLVVTKYRDTDPHDVLRQAQADILDPIAKTFVEFLLQNQERICVFPHPAVLDKQDEARDKIWKSIKTTSSLQNPQPRIILQPGSELLVLTLAQKLNQSIAPYLQREGTQKIVEACLQKIKGHTGTAAQLRRTFSDWADKLQSLQRSQWNDPLEFTRQLSTIFDASAIERTIKALEFLKKIDRTIPYDAANWSTTLPNIVTLIRTQLVATPQSSYANGVLQLKGLIIGASESGLPIV